MKTELGTMQYPDGYEYRPAQHCGDRHWFLFHNGVQKGAIERDTTYDYGEVEVRVRYVVYRPILCPPVHAHGECHTFGGSNSCKRLKRGETQDFEKCKQFLVDEVSGKNEPIIADIYGWSEFGNKIYLFKSALILTTINGKWSKPDCVGRCEGSGFVWSYEEALEKLKECRVRRLRQVQLEVQKLQEEVDLLTRRLDSNDIEIVESDARQETTPFYD